MQQGVCRQDLLFFARVLGLAVVIALVYTSCFRTPISPSSSGLPVKSKGFGAKFRPIVEKEPLRSRHREVTQDTDLLFRGRSNDDDENEEDRVSRQKWRALMPLLEQEDNGGEDEQA